MCDREAHAHGLHTRAAHRQMSSSSQCAECRLQTADLDAHAPAEPMRRRFAGRVVVAASQRGALAIGDED
jgi:hypothetical protein